MDLSHLNKSQRDAVLRTEGPVMILAGAGSGKTRTLVSRIQFLLSEKKVSPFRVLAVTFSNKAAKEMRERVAADSSIDYGAIQITTFHSFCARVLRNEAQFLGLSRNFTIYDTSESKTVVKHILGKRGINQKEIHPNEVLSFFDALKNSGYYLGCTDQETLDEVDQDDLFFSFFKEYEGEVHRSNAVDFGSLITGVLNLFENFPEVLERYQARYHYLLVDEFQDTNRAQFRLIKLLSDKSKNICVVGDEDQSIYSWRGADIRNILDFEQVYPDAHLIKLEQNYRSSKNIIEAASVVISKNIGRKGKKMWTENEQGESIKIIDCADDKAEAEFVAQNLQGLIHQGIDPKEMAVFYRGNSQSRLIEDSLRRLNIPYRVVAGIKFYERKEVKDLLAYVRCIVNDKDSLALSRVINVPTRGIGARTLRKIEDEAIKYDFSLWEILNAVTDNYENFKHLKLSAKVRSGIGSFVGLIHEAKILEKKNEEPSVIFEKILHESSYLENLEIEKSYESLARIENINELLSAIQQYQNDEEEPSLVGFLETITLDTSGAESESTAEVSLMTIHGSKGLEYLYVFITGVEEAIIPSFQSMEHGESAIEEERRLFYVAMTRAMKKLYILCAQGRMTWGQVRFNAPSRFIDEIPEHFYESISYRGSRNNQSHDLKSRNIDFDFSDEFSQDNNFSDEFSSTFVNSSSASIEFTFPVGTAVSHKLYGEGKVSDAEGFGKEEKVVIVFKDGTRKKFLIKFAPIVRL